MYSWNKTSTIRDLKKKLNKYDGLYGNMLSEENKRDIREILAQIKAIQMDCVHLYEFNVLFNIGRFICCKCDYEKK